MRLLTEYLKAKNIKLSSVIDTFMNMFSRDTIEIFDEIEKIDDNKVKLTRDDDAWKYVFTVKIKDDGIDVDYEMFCNGNADDSSSEHFNNEQDAINEITHTIKDLIQQK